LVIGVFSKRILTDKLDSLDAEQSADRGKPDSILRRRRIRQVVRPAGAVRALRDGNHSVHDIIDRHEIQRLRLEAKHAQRQMHRAGSRGSPAKPFKRRPQKADERIHAVKMCGATGFGVADDDTRAIDGSDDRTLGLLAGDEQLRLTLRLLVSILERLAGVDFRLQCEIGAIAGDICRTDMLQTRTAESLDEIEHVPRAADVHAENLIAIFLLERQGRCAMPDLVRVRREAFSNRAAQAEIGMRDVTLEDFQVLEMRYANLTQHLLDATLRNGVLRATR
jgi:hypothetical protein